jgi:demethylsterigmatocystin 6-O-methyltransferase
MSQVSDTVDALNKAAESLPTDVEERRRLYKAARRLMFSVESPHEATQRLYYGGLPLILAIVGIDLGLFKVLADHSDTSYYLEQLAKTTSADSLLLRETFL